MSGPAGTEDAFSPRRVLLVSGVLVLAASAAAWVARGPSSALSLTGSGAVAIINFHWLEGVLSRVIQPGSPRVDRWSALRFLLRLLLLGAVFGAMLWLPRVDPVAVAVGFSALVVALIVEGVRSGLHGGG